MDLKAELIKHTDVNEQDFDTHASDLYVRYTPRVEQWLKDNYPFYTNTSLFISNVDNKTWLDLPFANDEWWNKKTRSIV